MTLVSDVFKRENLKKSNINIKTKYLVNGQILERNSNESYNDDVKNGIRTLKEYYVGNKLCHTEKVFNPKIEYSFMSKNFDSYNYTCSNCGVTSELSNFVNGCPYCKSYYNIDYVDKDLDIKYLYNLVKKKNLYRLIIGIVDLLFSFILIYILIKNTSTYSVAKVFAYGSILSLILYFVFYLIGGYIILLPFKILKTKEIKCQNEFWERTKIDRKSLFNNLNYEVRRMYYNKPNIIDYDILDFIEFEDINKNGVSYVKVKAFVRIVYFKYNRFFSKYVNDTYVLRRINDNGQLYNWANMVKCHNCGASVDVTRESCQYCGGEIKYFQNYIVCDEKEIK